MRRDIHIFTLEERYDKRHSSSTSSTNVFPPDGAGSISKGARQYRSISVTVVFYTSCAASLRDWIVHNVSSKLSFWVTRGPQLSSLTKYLSKRAPIHMYRYVPKNKEHLD